MQKKKSPSANLEKKRSVFLQTGFIAAVSFALAAFGYTSYEIIDYEKDWVSTINSHYVEDDLIPIYVPEKPKAQKAKETFTTVFTITDVDPTELDPKKDELSEIEIDFNFDDYGTNDDVPDVVFTGPAGIIPFMAVEKKPHFKSCENILNSNEEAQCTYLEIVGWVNSHARYPERSKAIGKSGIVNVSFVIDENGDVVDVKAENRVDADLEKEAIRVVKSLPKFIPGSQQGRKVKVPYRIPVKFVIK